MSTYLSKNHVKHYFLKHIFHKVVQVPQAQS